MNAMHKAFLILTAIIIAAVDAQAGRWLSRDPIEEGAGFVERAPLEPVRIILNNEPLRLHAQRLDPKRYAYRNEPNLYVFVSNDAVTKWDYLGLVVRGWPFAGEAENRSSATITIQGDWTAGGVDMVGTHDLPPGATMAGERRRGATPIVDSDFLISATATVYNSSKCIVIARLPVKIGVGTLVVRDCACRIGGKGIYYSGGTEGPR